MMPTPVTRAPSPARCVTTVLCSTLLAASVVTVLPGPAYAADDPGFQVPFVCGQDWYASTRSGHSPSYWSVDFNADDDLGKPVVASAAGVVTSVVDLGDTSYGRYVVVDHGGGWTSLYAHLLDTAVMPGQRVDEGQTLGRLGTSGGSTGPHLHFEQRLDRVDQPAVFNGTELDYGSWITSRTCVDVPVTGDWDGNGRTDLGLFRRSANGGTFRRRLRDGSTSAITWGRAYAQPVTGDWAGNGVDQPGTYSPVSRRFSLRYPDGSRQTVKLGRRGAVPVTGDWDGNGTTDVGVWNSAAHRFRLRLPDGSVVGRVLGDDGDVPVAGDWDGNGKAGVGVYDPDTATFVLRLPQGRERRRTVGVPGSIPVTGDFNGDGRTDLGTWNPATGTFDLSTRRLDGTRYGRRRTATRARLAATSASRETPQQVPVLHTD